jgi:hypothetical protein
MDGPAGRRVTEAAVQRTVDIGGIPVSIQASDPERAEAMEDLFWWLDDGVGPPAAALRYGRRSPELPERAPDETYDHCVVWREGTALGIRDVSGLAAWVTPELAYFGGSPASLVEPFWRVFYPAVTHLLAHRERFIVHGGAMVANDCAYLVLGESESGKSTLGLTALEAGWRLLADDGSILRPEAGGCVVTGLPRPVAAPSDLGGRVAGECRPIPGDLRGRRQLAPDHLERGWWALGGVVLVGHSRSPAGELAQAGGRQTLSAVLGSFCSVTDRELLRSFFPLAAHIGRLPGWTLGLGADPSTRLAEAQASLNEVCRHGSSFPPRLSGERVARP